MRLFSKIIFMHYCQKLSLITKNKIKFLKYDLYNKKKQLK